MNSKKDDVLRAFYDEIAESVAEAPDADVVEECSAEGESVEQVAHHMRDVLRTAWTGFQQRSLREAREKYQRTTSVLKATVIQLPVTPAERRQMFTGVLARRPDVGKTIHIQFRDYDQMSDEDIETSLQQFNQLGLLSDGDDEEK